MVRVRLGERILGRLSENSKIPQSWQMNEENDNLLQRKAVNYWGSHFQTNLFESNVDY